MGNVKYDYYIGVSSLIESNDSTEDYTSDLSEGEDLMGDSDIAEEN